mgnify:FL=1
MTTITVENKSFSNLQNDLDGDGVMDEEWTPSGDLVVVTEPELYTYTNLKELIGTIENSFAQRYLNRLADKAERFNQYSEYNSRYTKYERFYLTLLERSVRWLERRNRIPEEVANNLIDIIQSLKTNK